MPVRNQVRLKLIFDYDGDIYIYRELVRGAECSAECIYKKSYNVGESIEYNRQQAYEEFKRLEKKYYVRRKIHAK